MARLGVMIEGQEGLTWERWNNIVDTTEQLGFDSVWRSDHLESVMGEYDRETLALWPSLTAVALRTSRVEFGPMVCPTTFRSPVHLAMNAATLDSLSGGRFWMGVGAGWNVHEHNAFGFDLPPLKARMDRFEEGLKVITKLWSGDAVTFEGEHFQLREARNGLKPSRGAVPIVIGGSGEKRTLRLVAEYAAEWNATSMPRDAYPAKVDALLRHCEAIGRDPGTIVRSQMVGYLIGRDQAGLRHHAERIQQMIPSLRERDPDELPALLGSRGWLTGTPDAIIAEIKAREALGITRFQLQTHDFDDLEPLRILAEEVIPHVG